MGEQSTREQILEAALRLLREGGPDTLTQTRVARAAGVSQGHLTYYFPRKSDLWRCVLQRAIEVLADQFARTKPPDGDGVMSAEARQRWLAELAELVKDRGRTVVFLGLCLQATHDPETRKAFDDSIAEMKAAFARVLGPGAGEAADFALSTVWGLCIQNYLAGGLDDDHVARVLAQAFAPAA